MKCKLDQQEKNTSPVRAFLLAALVLACAFGTVTHATAQRVTPPTTPIGITPPVGNSAFLVGHAEGTQGYVCLPTGDTSWTAPTGSCTVGTTLLVPYTADYYFFRADK